MILLGLFLLVLGLAAARYPWSIFEPGYASAVGPVVGHIVTEAFAHRCGRTAFASSYRPYARGGRGQMRWIWPRRAVVLTDASWQLFREMPQSEQIHALRVWRDLKSTGLDDQAPITGSAPA